MAQNDINKKLSQKGINLDELKSSKNPEEILSKLNSTDAQKINNILNNPKETEKLLNSPAAKALFSQLFSDGKK